MAFAGSWRERGTEGVGGGQRGSRRGFLLAAPLLPHAYIGISFFLSYFLTLRRMDPSSKSPDVEVNCKDEDRKGGAGRRRGGT